MADHRSATLTPNYTGPPATAATVPTARVTQMAPTARDAGRISSALGTTKPALPVTVVLWVSDRQCQPQPDGLERQNQYSLSPQKTKFCFLGVRAGEEWKCAHSCPRQMTQALPDPPPPLCLTKLNFPMIFWCV